MRKGYLTLSDGTTFEGNIPEGMCEEAEGEVVFTTGMCGYPESLTDPSFSGQILVFTYPLIGNYGVAPQSSWESRRVHPAGVVVSESCYHWSHHQGERSLEAWLSQEQVPLLTGIDTRALTKVIRTGGTLRGRIGGRPALPCRPPVGPAERAASVSIRDTRVVGKGARRLILVDCGAKESILRALSAYPVEILQVPYNYDYSEIPFDGLFLSNGPGDPADYIETIASLRKVLHKEKPIFGICLGTQILALAAGATTTKLKFGHRGHNQPCVEVATGRGVITSQNHGYAVVEESLPEGWRVTFRNLNDGSVEGIAHTSLPFCGVQFHPEAAPGPTDSRYFFDRFYACLEGKSLF